MKIHRFIANFDFSQDELAITDTELVKQIRTVLRLRIGEQMILSNGQGEEALVKIIQIKPKLIEVVTLEKKKNNNEPKVKISLYCSIIKRENFELVVQKATELGVSKIIPLLLDRTVKTGVKKERLEKIIKEAAEQSGRGFLPELSDAMDLKTAIKDAGDKLILFFDISGKQLVSFKDIENKKVAMFIGPEGGWSEREIALVKQQKNFSILSLGKLTLRAETASIAAISSVLWLFE